MQVQPTYIPGWVRFAWQRHAPLALAALLRLGLLLRPHAAVLQPTCCRHSVSGADASLWQARCVMLPPLPTDVFTWVRLRAIAGRTGDARARDHE